MWIDIAKYLSIGTCSKKQKNTTHIHVYLFKILLLLCNKLGEFITNVFIIVSKIIYNIVMNAVGPSFWKKKCT